LKPAEGSFHTFETDHDRISKRPRLFYKDSARTVATTLERYPATEHPKMFSPAQKNRHPKMISPAQKNKHDRRAEHKRTKL
jgi:hypothetical protein